MRFNFFRAAAETAEHRALTDKTEHVEKQEEVPDSVVDEINLPSEGNDRSSDSHSEEHDEKKDTASEDQKPVASPSGDCADRSDALKEPDGIVTNDEAQPVSVTEPSSSHLERTQKDGEESVVSVSYTELQSGTTKESEGASAGEVSQSKELLKDWDMLSISGKKETDVSISNSITEKEENTGTSLKFACCSHPSVLLPSYNTNFCFL